MKNYRQCIVEKQSSTGNGTMTRTFWGDEEYATVGRVVKVQEDDGTWSQGWRVIFTSRETVSEKFVEKARHAHTKQRAASDI